MTGVIKPGLERISKLLAPWPLHWRAIHVAGTNGKGTVCAYISAMLDVYNNSQYRTLTARPPIEHGRFTSPHLVHRFDGITVNGQQPPSDDVDKWYNLMRRRNEEERIDASEFELLTATAFVTFQCWEGSFSSRPGRRIGVIEVGMGGRDDATNLLGQAHENLRLRAPPLVTAISNIGLDHQTFLGSTLSEIARNKAGIMKPGVPVVFDEYNKAEVQEVLLDEAGPERLQYNVDPAITITKLSSRYDEATAYKVTDEVMKGLPLHTRSNLDLAFKATWAALRVKDRVPQEPKMGDRSRAVTLALDMLKVHETVEIPGRLQFLDIKTLTGRESPVLLDGAHNEQSAIVLAEAVQKLRAGSSVPHKGVVWVIAASKGKDLHSILKHLVDPVDKVLAVKFGPVAGMPWVQPQSDVDIMDVAQNVAFLSPEQCSHFGENILGALKAATKMADGSPLVIAGSLYLVGDVLRLIQQSEAG